MEVSLQEIHLDRVVILSVGFTLAPRILIFMDADGLQEIWILIVLCFFFTPFLGVIVWGFSNAVYEMVHGDDNGDGCSACTACLGIIALNAGMIAAFLSSRTEAMPHALQVSGANEWQVGNFSTVNGIYHLRTDLRDGKPSSLCTHTCGSLAGPNCVDCADLLLGCVGAGRGCFGSPSSTWGARVHRLVVFVHVAITYQ